MKKAIIIICTVTAAFLLCHFCIFAGVENGEAVVVFDTAGGLPGETVEVNVHLTKNPGIMGLRFVIEYDERALKLESAEYTELGGGGLAAVKTDINPFVLIWNLSTKEFTETGVLATMKFKIKEGADVAELPLKVSYNRGDCIDFNLKNLVMNITEGKVKVLYDGTNCSHRETQKITTAEASCNKLGTYEIRCAACGTLITEGNIPYTEHSWGSFIVKKEPTYYSDGYMEKECAACKDTVRQSIPKYEHTGEDSVLDSDTVAPPNDTTQDTGEGSSAVTDNPATGDETWVLVLSASASLVFLLYLIIKRSRDKKRADPTIDHTDKK